LRRGADHVWPSFDLHIRSSGLSDVRNIDISSIRDIESITAVCHIERIDVVRQKHVHITLIARRIVDVCRTASIAIWLPGNVIFGDAGIEARR
jgi:hypothetical protein